MPVLVKLVMIVDVHLESKNLSSPSLVQWLLEDKDRLSFPNETVSAPDNGWDCVTDVVDADYNGSVVGEISMKYSNLILVDPSFYGALLDTEGSAINTHLHIVFISSSVDDNTSEVKAFTRYKGRVS
jgi:hypothetical protein